MSQCGGFVLFIATIQAPYFHYVYSKHKSWKIGFSFLIGICSDTVATFKNIFQEYLVSELVCKPSPTVAFCAAITHTN